MEIAVGLKGAMCHECEKAGCEGDAECCAEGAYGGMPEPADCPMCGGEGGELGKLGSLTHYRCRACGMDFSREAA